MKRRSRQPARKGKDKGEQQQQRTSSVSSGDEISASRSISSGEESTGSPSRPPKKERRQNIHGMPVPYVKSSVELAKQHRAQQNKSSTGKINVGDIQVSSGIVQGPNQEQQMKHSGGSSDRPASISEGDAQAVAEAYVTSPSKVGSDSILLESCLDHAKLLNRSGSLEEQGVSFDEEISTWPKVEDKKPESYSGEPRSIEQDEDEHSGKITSCGDLGKMVAQDKDGQHSENIGAPGTEDHKESKGRAVEHEQALLDMDDDAALEELHKYAHLCRRILPDDCNGWPLPSYEPDQQTEVYEQLALYCIRGYQLSLEDRQLAELDDENLKKQYSSTDLSEEGYFQYYEKDLEWYFDPLLCMDPEFDNYQRLVLYNNGKYWDWDYYHSVCNTLEKDMAYVKYCDALFKETKWIVDHREHGLDKWNMVKVVAKIQALQIAARFPYVSFFLVSLAFDELIWTIESDYRFYKHSVCKFFEIWKRTAKLKMDLRQAYSEVLGEDYPYGCFEYKFNAFIAGIDEMASDDKARQDIVEGLLKVSPNPKILFGLHQ